MNTKSKVTVAAKPPVSIADSARIRVGDGMRIAGPKAPASVADTGRIRMGDGMRIVARS